MTALETALVAALAAVRWTEELARVVRTPQSAACLVAARRLLCEVELVAEMERVK
jgi:hypothetical protein